MYNIFVEENFKSVKDVMALKNVEIWMGLWMGSLKS